MGWSQLGILFAVAMVLSGVGFYNYVYFISVGYGLAVAGIGVSLIVMFGSNVGAVGFLLPVLFICYGARLSGYLIYRDIKSASYRKTQKIISSEYKEPNLTGKLGMWAAVCLLYVMQTSPVFYLLKSGGEGAALPWIGAIIAASALVLESVADTQKSRQKKQRPDMVATKGLYKYVRCPNYFSEILFWTGILLSGMGSFDAWDKWAIAILGYVLIVYVMFNGAYRLEKRQIKTYGDKDEYVKYADATPIIIPFVPIYHLAGKKK